MSVESLSKPFRPAQYSIGDRVLVGGAGPGGGVYTANYDLHRKNFPTNDIVTLEIIGSKDGYFYVLLSDDSDKYGGERITDDMVKNWGIDPIHKGFYGWPFHPSGFGGLAPKRGCNRCKVGRWYCATQKRRRFQCTIELGIG